MSAILLLALSGFSGANPAPPEERSGPELVVSVTGPQDLLAVGDQVALLISVTNVGDSVAHKIAVRQTVPAGLTPEKLGHGGRLSDDGSTITWERGALPPDQTLSLGWSAEVTSASSLAPSGDVVATADESQDEDEVRIFLASAAEPTFEGLAKNDSGKVSSAKTGRGDNRIYFTWQEGEGITEANSSRALRSKAAYELLTSLKVLDRGDGLEAKLTLRNLRDHKLRVRGRFVHRIYVGDAVLAWLRSRQIDVILRPGGEVRVPFKHGLPSGTYETNARFKALP